MFLLIGSRLASIDFGEGGNLIKTESDWERPKLSLYAMIVEVIGTIDDHQ